MNFFYLKKNIRALALFFCFTLAASSQNVQASILSSLIKVKPEKNEPFHNLRLTNQDKENITYIITSLGEQGKLTLLVNKSELTRRGDLIQGVHPLKFLTVVFKDEYLKKVCMPAILKDYFKKKNFLDGLGANMTREAQKGKLQKYMPDFLNEINLSSEHSENLLKFVETRDWEGFIRHIVNN